MNNFYCLYNTDASSLDLKQRIASLQRSCEEIGVKFKEIDQKTVNHLELPKPTGNDAIYNMARGSFTLETLLMNRSVRTIYRNYNFIFLRDDPGQIEMELEKNDIPIAKTIYLGTNDRILLEKYIEFLGEFPIVIKMYASTGGQGAIKVSDFQTLFSLTDFLISTNQAFQIKEFIPAKTCERITVVGNTVAYSLSRPIPANDFRSNAFAGKVKLVNLSKEIEDIAIKATHAANLNYAGIDLIIDERTKEPKVLEINCPQNFAHHEEITGRNCGKYLVDFLFKDLI